MRVCLCRLQWRWRWSQRVMWWRWRSPSVSASRSWSVIWRLSWGFLLRFCRFLWKVRLPLPWDTLHHTNINKHIFVPLHPNNSNKWLLSQNLDFSTQTLTFFHIILTFNLKTLKLFPLKFDLTILNVWLFISKPWPDISRYWKFFPKFRPFCSNFKFWSQMYDS